MNWNENIYDTSVPVNVHVIHYSIANTYEMDANKDIPTLYDIILK